MLDYRVVIIKQISGVGDIQESFSKGYKYFTFGQQSVFSGKYCNTAGIAG
jgi:hypothetical protein